MDLFYRVAEFNLNWYWAERINDDGSSALAKTYAEHLRQIGKELRHATMLEF